MYVCMSLESESESESELALFGLMSIHNTIIIKQIIDQGDSVLRLR